MNTRQIDLSGRVALITGASGAVGSAVMAHLRLRGASVAGALSGKSESVGGFAADLGNESEVVRLFDAVEQRFGPLEILVHTVGGFEAGGALAETSLEVWERMHRLNVQTAFLCLREALRRMQSRSYGRIVLFGAATGLDLPPRRGAYGMAKAAVHHLTQIAAQEAGGSGVTINAIAPYIIDTPANRSWSTPESATWVPLEEICRVIEVWCDPASSENGVVLRLPRRD